MLKIIVKTSCFFIIVSLLFLIVYSFAIYQISNLNNQDKIVFVVISWIVFIITFAAMTLLYTIQMKRQFVSQKVWNAILLLFVVFPGILSIYYFFNLFINSTAYMIIYPLNGIFSATIRVCPKIVKTGDSSAS